MNPDSIHGRLEIIARGLLRWMIRDAAEVAKHTHTYSRLKNTKKKHGRGAKPVPPPPVDQCTGRNQGALDHGR